MQSRAQEDRLKLHISVTTSLAPLQAQYPTDQKNDQSIED